MSSAAELLVDTARRGELHHSVILHGPVADALRELALRLACALNCVGNAPPDDCVSCRKIARGMHPDVHLIGVEENRKMIAVEQIREMVAGATLRPYEGRTKVFIIDGAETVSGAGANAMLKTLEEPTADTVFILLARSADLLLPTIRSRSQAIAIQPALESPRGEAPGSLQAERLRRAVAGLPGADAAWTESAARSIIEAAAAYASKGDIAALLAAAADPLCDADPAAALHLLAIVLRDLGALAPEESLDPEATRAIQRAIDRERLLEAAAIAIRNATRLTVNTDPRLLIEQALLRIAREA